MVEHHFTTSYGGYSPELFARYVMSRFR